MLEAKTKVSFSFQIFPLSVNVIGAVNVFLFKNLCLWHKYSRLLWNRYCSWGTDVCGLRGLTLPTNVRPNERLTKYMEFKMLQTMSFVKAQ